MFWVVDSRTKKDVFYFRGGVSELSTRLEVWFVRKVWSFNGYYP